MFFPASAPPDRDAQGLRALCRSLNTPVIAIDVLPSGPASAAIALHAGPDHAPRVTIALRSTRTGQLAFFSADEERAPFGSSGVEMDAALSFAESMGFLFDDDEALGDAGSEHAAQIWLAFVSADRPAESVRAEPEELLLEEVHAAEVEPAEADRVHAEVEIEARNAELSDRSRKAAPAPAEAEPEEIHLEPELDARADASQKDDWDPVDENDEIPGNEVPEVHPALLLTKFRRGSDASRAPELPGDRNDTQIRVMSRF
jgi:hypothetical protein